MAKGKASSQKGGKKKSLNNNRFANECFLVIGSSADKFSEAVIPGLQLLYPTISGLKTVAINNGTPPDNMFFEYLVLLGGIKDYNLQGTTVTL